MEELLEILSQIQEMAGVAIDAIQQATGGEAPPEGEAPPPGGPEAGGPPPPPEG